MISRVIVIALAFVVAAVRFSQGAWVEGSGLVGLGAGLIIWHLSERRRALRPLAWVGFAATAVAVVTTILRTTSTF